jgi:hypothetical protein
MSTEQLHSIIEKITSISKLLSSNVNIRKTDPTDSNKQCYTSVSAIDDISAKINDVYTAAFKELAFAYIITHIEQAKTNVHYYDYELKPTFDLWEVKTESPHQYVIFEDLGYYPQDNKLHTAKLTFIQDVDNPGTYTINLDSYRDIESCRENLRATHISTCKITSFSELDVWLRHYIP